METVVLHGALARGRVASIDDGDLGLIQPHRWLLWENIRKSGTPNGPYAVTYLKLGGGKYKMLRMHTLLTGWPRVDHVDHDGLNNQRYNLRPVTNAQNMQNARKRNWCSSRFKGVSWDSAHKRWVAYIKVNGRRIHLGTFEDEEDAARAYDAAAISRFGQYACPNFAA